MRLAFFGDVMGRSGRSALAAHMPMLIRKLDVDFVIVNGENAAGGYGITRRIAEDLFDLGVDVITTGNHAFDQRDDLALFDREDRVLRPANFMKGTPGRGSGLYTSRTGQRVLIIHLQGQLFMKPTDHPLPALEAALDRIVLGREAEVIVVDIHAEASSEKYALAHYLDGRVSLVVGTHTHIPTADAQILPMGTGFQCDAGMCGDYDSVIGMEKSAPVARFATQLPGPRLSPATGEATICGVFLETDPQSGLAKRVEPIRFGGRLAPVLPALKGRH